LCHNEIALLIASSHALFAAVPVLKVQQFSKAWLEFFYLKVGGFATAPSFHNLAGFLGKKVSGGVKPLRRFFSPL
jgi:hypothetical protein